MWRFILFVITMIHQNEILQAKAVTLRDFEHIADKINNDIINEIHGIIRYRRETEVKEVKAEDVEKESKSGASTSAILPQENIVKAVTNAAPGFKELQPNDAKDFLINLPGRAAGVFKRTMQPVTKLLPWLENPTSVLNVIPLFN